MSRGSLKDVKHGSPCRLARVPAAAAQSQSLTELHQAVGLGLVLEALDHGVELPGSWPKMPKAFFKKSRCRLTRSSSRSSSLIRWAWAWPAVPAPTWAASL